MEKKTANISKIDDNVSKYMSSLIVTIKES